ncbi:TPA: SDR family NAD(P)-dependent oxidoreductase [Legionella pneumophila]|nr:SDR family oxidoreductase [Legionella pneumophila]MCK1859569.1 SDR family oxidoreductase [Legionella pneumophila]HDV5714075.1 SDR family oxidoreductase [Legionella pneumophila]HDV5941473.1 SDR family oxidoreductase [Legionella pneumophila]HEL9698475.1 SDR family oxidoreductase [Legionella pneumophila]HEO1456164.1 SDR family oxidoreductase [Legionella pneumophila]
MQRLSNRIAVITGGASGLGRAAALRLFSEGAIIEILDLQDSTEVCSIIHGLGGIAYGQICDVTSEKQVAKAVKKITVRHSHIDILVNNAGILSEHSPWHTLTITAVDKFIKTNYLGYFIVTKALYPLITKSQYGRVINIASRTFFLGNPGQMAYVASKGAVIGMTRVLAKELGKYNITVNALMPGMIATPGTCAHSEEERFNQMMQNQAIKKRVQPEHFAALIAFIASDEAEMITGQNIICDGGGYLH